MQTLVDPFVYRPENILSCIHFKSSGNGGTLICAANVITPYQLQNGKLSNTQTKSHEFPVRSAIHNPDFGQVVSACDGGIVNVWDVQTGEKTFRLKANPDGNEITAMSFDDKVCFNFE